MTDFEPVHGILDVSDEQSIYWEQWGNPDGLPALFIHGGPGGTLGKSGYRHRFDLDRTRVIGFEQRGCGRSKPHASVADTSLSSNTLERLIDDIERLRESMRIDTWILNGVSWGSTLALAYAQAHPERVRGIVLFAVTTTSQDEIRWITEGVGKIFPEAWERLASYAENNVTGYKRGSRRLIEAYRQLMNSEDMKIRNEASKEWALWEDTHVSIGTDGFVRDARWDNEAFRLAFVRLTTHYWSIVATDESEILKRMNRIQHIPATLIHGRRDISSPAATAWKLHRLWPNSTLIIDEGDRHGGASMVEHWTAANARLSTES